MIQKKMTSINKEVNGFLTDQYNSKLSIESERQKFANKLLNGMGEEMKYQLENPVKPSRWEIFKINVKVFFKRLNNIL